MHIQDIPAGPIGSSRWDTPEERSAFRAQTPIRVQAGPWAGHMIRRARKAGHCHYWKGANNGGTCRAPLAPGDLYLEGEPQYDFNPNPFAVERWCMECAGEEARAAIAEDGGSQ